MDTPTATALLIVDMQIALVEGAFQEQNVLNNVQALLRLARQANAPVIYVQHNHATFEPMMKTAPGWEIHPQLAPKPADIRIEKEASDAFYGTDLATRLGARAATRIVLCGMMTEYCVDATARSALSHDFDVILASDAHTTGNSTLTASQIITHHNTVLPNVVHPTRSIVAIPSREVTF